LAEGLPAVVKLVHEPKQNRLYATTKIEQYLEIIEDLEAHGGISSLTDKSSPQDIQTRFNVSKGAYKKALGQLYKNKKILISATHITLEKAKP